MKRIRRTLSKIFSRFAVDAIREGTELRVLIRTLAGAYLREATEKLPANPRIIRTENLKPVLRAVIDLGGREEIDNEALGNQAALFVQVNGVAVDLVSGVSIIARVEPWMSPEYAEALLNELRPEGKRNA